MFVWETLTQYLTEHGGQPAGFHLRPPGFLAGRNLFDTGNLYQDLLVKRPLWHFGMQPEWVGATAEELPIHRSVVYTASLRALVYLSLRQRPDVNLAPAKQPDCQLS